MLDLFASFTRDRQGQLLESMGQGMRMQLLAAAPPNLRRRTQGANGPVSMVAQDLMAVSYTHLDVYKRQP